MTDEQIASIQYAADWLSRSEDIGNRKHAERLRALLAAGASEGQEPVAQIVRDKTVAGLDLWDIKIFDKTLQNGAKLYKDPSAEIAALRERIAGMEKDAERWRKAVDLSHYMIDANGEYVLVQLPAPEGCFETTEQQFVAAIDAAIAKEKK